MTAPGRTAPAGPVDQELRMTLNGDGQIVAVNGRPRVKVDDRGEPIRADGYRVRVDDVLIDAEDRPVMGPDGPRRWKGDGRRWLL